MATTISITLHENYCNDVKLQNAIQSCFIPYTRRVVDERTLNSLECDIRSKLREIGREKVRFKLTVGESTEGGR